MRTSFRFVTVAEVTQINTFITTNNKFEKMISTELCAFYNIMKFPLCKALKYSQVFHKRVIAVPDII